MQAHRLAYELVHAAEVPAGLVLDHLCRNTLCVNPGHLEPVTQAVNASRQIKIPLTHCRRGRHEMTPENTYFRFKDGRIRSRQCRICVDQGKH